MLESWSQESSSSASQRHDGRHLTGGGQHDDGVDSVIPEGRGVQRARAHPLST